MPARTTLADFLRERLALTGTHLGCEHGVCGACTVLLDGQAARSCLTLAHQADGHAVDTVEVLAGDPADPNSAAAAFLRHRAFQCGFCTPGFVATIEALRRAGADPAPEELRHLLSGNLCRCTGYGPIVAAAAELMGRR